MGKSTIVYKGPSNQPSIWYFIKGYQAGNTTSGSLIASGNVGSNGTFVVSGYNSYRFFLATGGVSIKAPTFNNGNDSQIMVLFGAEG